MSEMKQVIVVRADLRLSHGKFGSQVGHAVMGAYFDQMDRWGEIGPDMVGAWNDEGKKKVCLRVDSEEALLALAQQCEDANIGHYLVRDAGRTELAPDTPSALGIGPEFNRHVNKITGDLELF